MLVMESGNSSTHLGMKTYHARLEEVHQDLPDLDTPVFEEELESLTRDLKGEFVIVAEG